MTHGMIRAILLATALAACSTAPRDELPTPQLPQRAGIDPLIAARAEGVVFRAQGANPDFVLHLYRDDRIFVSWDQGARQEHFPASEPILPAYRGRVFETRNEHSTLRVDIRDGPCRDEALGPQVFSATVIVWIDGVERRGCGRDL
jgi:hypothetical protein